MGLQAQDVIEITTDHYSLRKGERYQVLYSQDGTCTLVSQVKQLYPYRHVPVDELLEISRTLEVTEAPKEPINYYEMPNGIQVKEISRYLTSNGGQAVQYIARSSRLDGKIKGTSEDRVKDLRKAIDFLNDEIERLEKGPNE